MLIFLQSYEQVTNDLKKDPKKKYDILYAERENKIYEGDATPMPSGKVERLWQMTHWNLFT